MKTPQTHEELLELWLDTEPSAQSPYGLYGYPAMWKTMEAPGGFVLFTRPSTTQVRGPGMQWQEVKAVSWQWQKDGKWFDQASVAQFDSFFKFIDEVRNSTVIRMGQLAIITPECAVGTSDMAGLLGGTIVVVEETHPDPKNYRAIVRNAFNLTDTVAMKHRLQPIDPEVDLEAHLREQLIAHHGEEKGEKKFSAAMKTYRKLVASNQIPDVSTLDRYCPSEPEQEVALTI